MPQVSQPSISTGDAKPLFFCEGRPVFRGDQLYVIQSRYLRMAGDVVTAEFEGQHDEVRVRSHNSAVPVLKISALSWKPNPDIEDRRRIMALIGSEVASDVSDRDLRMYRLGLSDSNQTNK